MGEWNVDALLEKMPAKLFDEWSAFFALEPWGTERDDWRSGMIASTIANVNRGKNRKAYRPQDFMPKQKKAPPTPEELWRRMRMIG